MTEIAKLIIECGVVPVFIATLIFVLIAVTKRVTKGNAEQEKRLTDLTTLVLSVQKKQENANKHTKQEEAEGHKISTFIDSQLKVLLRQTKGCRVYYYSYHNGGYSVNGRSFQKMSMQNEIVDMNVPPIMGQFQGIPRKMFSIIDNTLVKEGHFYIDDIETIKEEDNGTYFWFNSRGTKSVYMQIVRDNVEDVCLGFIGVEYDKQEKRDLYVCKLSLSKIAQTISGALQMTQEESRENEY